MTRAVMRTLEGRWKPSTGGVSLEWVVAPLAPLFLPPPLPLHLFPGARSQQCCWKPWGHYAGHHRGKGECWLCEWEWGNRGEICSMGIQTNVATHLLEELESCRLSMLLWAWWGDLPSWGIQERLSSAASVFQRVDTGLHHSDNAHFLYVLQFSIDPHHFPLLPPVCPWYRGKGIEECPGCVFCAFLVQQPDFSIPSS